VSRTIRKSLNLETGKPEKTRDNKPRCQCCCNPRHSTHGNKKEKLTIQERRENHNKLNTLFTIVLASTLLFFIGLASLPAEDSKRAKILHPLFGHFYPNASTNTLSIPNSRYGSGIR
jgi:hypothetical protein